MFCRISLEISTLKDFDIPYGVCKIDAKNNFINLEEFFNGNHKKCEKAYSPMTIRFFILQAHYRSTIEFSNKALQAAEKGFKKLNCQYKLRKGLATTERYIGTNPLRVAITGMCIDRASREMLNYEGFLSAFADEYFKAIYVNWEDLKYSIISEINDYYLKGNNVVVTKKLNEKSMAPRIRKTPKNEYNAFVKIYLNTFIPKCSFNRLEQHQNCYYQK